MVKREHCNYWLSNKANVVLIELKKDQRIIDVDKYTWYNPFNAILYEKGEPIEVKDYNISIGHGIRFYLTKEDATSNYD